VRREEQEYRIETEEMIFVRGSKNTPEKME
jgi:hypothetical protein